MSPRDWLERFRDILDAIAEIQTFTAGMDYGSFSGDAKTIRAVNPRLLWDTIQNDLPRLIPPLEAVLSQN